MPVHDLNEFFTDIPWQGIAGFLATLGLAGALFGKWIPGLRKVIESVVGWFSGIVFQSVNERIDKTNNHLLHLTDRYENHISDENAHHPAMANDHP